MKNNFALLLLVPLIFLAEKTFSQTWDPYGGNTNLSFPELNNEYFSTIEHEGQWFMVTPAPWHNAFLSVGLNHFSQSLWRRDYNSSYWQTVFGGGVNSNIWREGWYEHSVEIARSVGANTMPYHSSQDGILNDNDPIVPCIIRQYRPLEISLHRNADAADYLDVFSDAFKETCDEKARTQVRPYVNDKTVCGFAMSDVPVLTEGYARQTSGRGIPTFAMVLRNLNKDAPGKLEYVKTMKILYDSIIEDFNVTYGTHDLLDSWEDLENLTNWRERTDFNNAREMSDNNAFNKICIRKYYEVALASFRREDPHHLFFGDKINANAEVSELELMVDAIKDFCDVILYQHYARNDDQRAVQDVIARVGGKPMMNGDTGYGAADEPDNMPDPQRPTVATQAERAVAFNQLAEYGFSNPNFVGLHICGVIDSWETAASGRQKPGIMNPLGVPHQATIDTLATLAWKAYEFRKLDVNDSPTDPLSVVEQTESLEYTFWPNPTTGVIHFELEKYNEVYEITAFDNTGKLVDTFKPNDNHFDIKIEGKPGTYHIQVKSNTGTNTFKILKTL